MKKILVIDDDQAALHYYLRTLRECGFQVKHDRNPDAAWRSVSQGQFDLVILDSAMPPGKRYGDRESEEGLTTGGLIFHDIVQVYDRTPILILTNFVGLDWITNACTRPKVRAFRKLDLQPSRLVEIITEMLDD